MVSLLHQEFYWLSCVGMMTQTVQAIYERGVLKPLKRLRAREHQRVILTVRTLSALPEGDRATVEILSDPVQVKRIASALTHLRQGKLLTHADVFGRPHPTP